MHKPRNEKIPRQIRRGIRLSLSLSVGIGIAVLLYTAEFRTLTAFLHFRAEFFFVMVVLWLVALLVDSMRLSVLSRASPEPIGVLRSAEVLLVGSFMAAITPFQTGGLPVQLYLLKKNGINPGRASALLLYRGVLHSLPIYLLAPFVALKLGATSHWAFRPLAGWLILVITLGTLFVLALIFKPGFLKRRFKNGGEGRWFGRLCSRLVQEAEEFGLGIRLFLKNRNLKYLLGGSILSLLFLFLRFLSVPVILLGLGVRSPLLKTMGVQLLLSALLLFIPTPGASGVAEASGAILYSTVCPKYLLGLLVVLWRFCSLWLGALVGGIIALKEVYR